MSRRLFHAIVIVGTAMGCSSSETVPRATDAAPDVANDAASSDASVDTFPGIMPMQVDSGTDTFPTIAADTFPGIMPMMTDTFPGIMPPPPPPPEPS